MQQTIMPASSFPFTLENIALSEPEMCVGTRSLWQAGCDAILLAGTPFTYAGEPTASGARRRQGRISQAAGGLPIVLIGLAIIDACHALGVSRPACCTTYYPANWRAAWNGFLTDAGLKPEVMLSMDQLGMVENIEDVSEHGWMLTPDRIADAARAVRAQAPNSDCVLISGAGASTQGLIQPLEEEFGVPVIGEDGVVIWGVARALDVALNDGCLGMLTHARIPE